MQKTILITGATDKLPTDFRNGCENPLKTKGK